MTASVMVIQPEYLSGSVQAIPSKSDAHRRLICAALSDSETAITIGPDPLGDDIQSTIHCLRALGARIVRADDRRIVVYPVRHDLSEHEEVILDCGESGSTLRFILPIAAALGQRATVIGHGRLPERPIDELIASLAGNGAVFSSDRLPLKIGGQLHAGTFRLSGGVSSQYVSGLLFALPLLSGPSRIELTTPLESAAYVDMTLRTLRESGVRIEVDANDYRIPEGQKFDMPEQVMIEGDWSNGAFFLAAGAMNTPVNVAGLSPTSAQPDVKIIEAINDFGSDAIRVRNGYSVFSRPMRGIVFSARNTPDLVPIISVLACAAQGTTRIINAGRLRLKESDRLRTVSVNLRALGAEIEEDADSLTIRGGGTLRGGEVDGSGDHRIVMAMAVASTICEEPVVIRGWEAVEKSYPTFFEDFRSLGGVADVLDRE